MAYIRFSTSDKVVFLHTAHLFGRKNLAANSSVDSHLVSRNHASIEWNGEAWRIRDLSRNGTWLNGKQLNEQRSKGLRINDKVSLGNNDGKGIDFVILNLDEPKSVIYRPYPDIQIIPIRKSNLIPDPASPDFGLYYCHDRKGWFSHLFNNEETKMGLEEGPHIHGTEIIQGGNRWTLFLLDQDSASNPVDYSSNLLLNDVEFQVFFNRKNDDIKIKLISKDNEFELEADSYTKTLAVLIGLQQSSKDGWVKIKALCEKTSKSLSNIDLQLFTFQHQTQLSVNDCKGIYKIIERNGESLRLGINNFSIYRNGKLDQSSDYHF